MLASIATYLGTCSFIGYSTGFYLGLKEKGILSPPSLDSPPSSTGQKLKDGAFTGTVFTLSWIGFPILAPLGFYYRATKRGPLIDFSRKKIYPHKK